MPSFTYTAKTSDDKIITGEINAELESIAKEMIEKKDLEVVSIKEQQEKTSWDFNIVLFQRIPKKELVVMFRQLSVMLSAGLNLVDSLKILVEQSVNKSLQDILGQITNQVESGGKLSDSLATFPKIFNVFQINIIKSGEKAGRLNDVLNYLADQTEKDYDIANKIKGALIYPVVILLGMVAVGIIVMVYVVPNLINIVAEVGGDLPLSTKILIGTSNFLLSYWWLLLLLLIVIFVGIKVFLSSKNGRYFWDRLKFKIPIVSLLLKRIYLVRMTRSMYTLLVGRVTVVDSLEISAEVMGNEFFKKIMLETAKEVKDGGTISNVLLQYKEIPKMVPQMMVVGEKTGSLDVVLEKMSEFYNRELDNYVANLMVLMEPIIMIMLGVAVGIMVSAVILPMQQLATRF